MFVLMFRLQRYELFLIYANIFLEKKSNKKCIYTMYIYRKSAKSAENGKYLIGIL